MNAITLSLTYLDKIICSSSYFQEGLTKNMSVAAPLVPRYFTTTFFRVRGRSTRKNALVLFGKCESDHLHIDIASTAKAWDRWQMIVMQ